MHSPETVAFDIYLGRKQKRNGHYRTPFITIWHHDPEKDDTDDSCGWFIRLRHVDKKLVEKVQQEFDFNFKHDYWFNSAGHPKFSTHGIVLNMYHSAAWQVFMYLNNGKPDRKRFNRFFRKHLSDILYFAENPVDSIHDSIETWTHTTYTESDKTQRCRHFVSIILPDIMRKIRPWYKHPRWHIHHWEITFPAFMGMYRRYIERCDICRKRFKKQSVYGNWEGTKHWCEACNRTTEKVSPIKQLD